jgi:hypothetical protein
VYSMKIQIKIKPFKFVLYQGVGSRIISMNCRFTKKETDVNSTKYDLNLGSQLPLYAEGEMVTYQYVATPWTDEKDTVQKYFVAQVVFAKGSGKDHVFVIQYQNVYLNFPSGWKICSPIDEEDLNVLKMGGIKATGRESVYTGVVTLENKILLINMTPVQMKIYVHLVSECSIVRSWCPLGGKVPIGAPIVVKGSPHHGGLKSKGVFASEDIPGETIVGEYRGIIKVLPKSHLFETMESRYVLDAAPVSQKLRYFIVADKATYSAWTRYINRPNAKEQPNVVFETYKVSIEHPLIEEEFCVLVQTLRNIKKGEQLLVSYGCTTRY